MPRPSTAVQRRQQLLPVLAKAFARTGYRRATTAELAEACDVPENTLFRLWGGKKGMYLAALDYLYDRTVETWQASLAAGEAGSGRQRRAPRGTAERLLEHEGEHYGEHGLYRIIFTGLAEVDDTDIRRALRTMYGRFHAFVAECIAEHRDSEADDDVVAQLAWTVIGMATVAGIGRELRLVTKQQQRHLFEHVGKAVLDI